MSSLRERFMAMERRERIMVSALGVVAILALVYVLFGLGGGGADVALHPPTGTLPPKPIVTTSPSPSESPLPVTPETFGGKDPFEPLVVESAAGPAPAGSASPAPSTSTGGPASGGGTSGRSNRVTLEDIFHRSGRLAATVTVNGTRYTLEPGDKFGSNFQLISLTSRCGGFAFGDERFSLCVGQEVRK